MNHYNDRYERRVYIEPVQKLRGGKGDPNELRIKMNSKDKPKWLKR